MFSGTRTRFWVRVPEKFSGTRLPEKPEPGCNISTRQLVRASEKSGWRVWIESKPVGEYEYNSLASMPYVPQ